MVTEKQKQSVKLFWKGMKVHEVAEILGVHRTTLWRWYHRPEMVRYAKQYCNRARYKLHERMWKKCMAELDSPDPDVSYERALKVVDMYLRWVQPNAYPSGGYTYTTSEVTNCVRK